MVYPAFPAGLVLRSGHLIRKSSTDEMRVSRYQRKGRVLTSELDVTRPKPSAALVSRRVGLGGRGERDGGFGSEVEEGDRFLQIKANVGVSVIQVADGSVLADVKIEVAAAGSDDEGAVNGGCPDNFSFDQAFDVFEDRIAVIAGFGEFGISVGAEQNGIGAIDADQSQLA